MTDDRAKTKRPPQFRGALNEPIYAPFDVPAADGELILGDGFYHVFEARLKKMSALAKHYKVEIPPDGLALAYALACDFVPGFQVRYDDPTARALGLPEADYGKGTKPKGAGAIPEVFGGTMLIEVFRWFQKTFPGESEAELADRIVPCIKPGLAGARHKTARAKIGKTLRNRLAKARRAEPASR